MGASSVTGTGQGEAGKFNIVQLDTLAKGPNIVFTGRISTEESLNVSPPTPLATVIFPQPLPGTGADYVVMLTGFGVENPVVQYFMQDGDTITGFVISSELEGYVMYLVATVGFRTNY